VLRSLCSYRKSNFCLSISRAQTGERAVTRLEYEQIHGRKYRNAMCHQLWDNPAPPRRILTTSHAKRFAVSTTIVRTPFPVIRASNSRDSTSPSLLALRSKEGIVITHDNPGVASSENGVRMIDLAERTQFSRMISSNEENSESSP
jgi:hypothetical protein